MGGSDEGSKAPPPKVPTPPSGDGPQKEKESAEADAASSLDLAIQIKRASATDRVSLLSLHTQILLSDLEAEELRKKRKRKKRTYRSLVKVIGILDLTFSVMFLLFGVAYTLVFALRKGGGGDGHSRRVMAFGGGSMVIGFLGILCAGILLMGTKTKCLWTCALWLLGSLLIIGLLVFQPLWMKEERHWGLNGPVILIRLIWGTCVLLHMVKIKRGRIEEMKASSLEKPSPSIVVAETEDSSGRSSDTGASSVTTTTDEISVNKDEEESGVINI